jgi:hypothetical protein
MMILSQYHIFELDTINIYSVPWVPVGLRVEGLPAVLCATRFLGFQKGLRVVGLPVEFCATRFPPGSNGSKSGVFTCCAELCMCNEIHQGSRKA